jgi:hypothetical protein
MYNKRVNRDRNHQEIVQGLVKLGFSVLDLAAVGSGCPDILVGITADDGTKYNVLMEIKSDKGKLRPEQKSFIENWNGSTCVVRTLAEAEFIAIYYKTLSKVTLEKTPLGLRQLGT